MGFQNFVVSNKIHPLKKSEGRVQGRTRFGWMDGEGGFGRWRLRDNARKIGRSREPWCICR